MNDAYDLRRFVDAQAPVYGQVLLELRSGEKKSHWMWFVFPQLKGLGHSPMAQRFALSSSDEAAAYLDHPVLGPRLIECTGIVNGHEGRTARGIFGHPDDLKFRSCMTLFALTAPDSPVFKKALDKYFDGETDPLTSRGLV
ncbi:MAG: DUF1810 domain-containing protein [Alphaproteobacteria bacterium]|nr:DUF1810 domain-containing protein [Alphaproteobacteria bacterium]